MDDENPLQTNLDLLRNAQEYLAALLAARQPDSLLAQSWDEFYRVYSEMVRRFVHAQGVHGADADDCVQTVWMAVARQLVHFEHPQDRPGLRAWLYTIVRSKAGDLFRRRSRRRTESLDRGLDAGAEPAAPDADPSKQFDGEWERALLGTMLADLRREVPEENFRLLEMRLVEGKDVAEVAAALDLEPEQVWYRQHRLVKKLKARMAVFTGEALGGTDEGGEAT
jgi:RNA polymerase sigma factor (sigma-70 family)